MGPTGGRLADGMPAIRPQSMYSKRYKLVISVLIGVSTLDQRMDPHAMTEHAARTKCRSEFRQVSGEPEKLQGIVENKFSVGRRRLATSRRVYRETMRFCGELASHLISGAS